MVPDAVGIDDSDRSSCAHLQAVGLGALDPAAGLAFWIDPFGTSQLQLIQASLKKPPGGLPFPARAALLLLAHRTQEDVAVDRFAAKLCEAQSGIFERAAIRH